MDAEEARIYTAIVISAFVIGIIIVYFMISITRQQKRNLALQKQSMLAEITAMEKERSRIAADLHDDLGPILSVIKFQVDNVYSASEDEKKQLDKASRHLDEMIARLREIANNLMPSALHRKGLITAIHEFLGRIRESSKLEISLECSEVFNLSEDVNINVYRAIQEAVHNTIRHSNASKLEVKANRRNGNLVIILRDNGQGFDYERSLKESKGIGIRSIKNRTEMVGGKLTVQSKPGKGTAYLFEVPIK